jgi:carbon-monoxide dehydrogenase iron sulfur subunit
MKKVIVVNVDHCLGCRSCQIACAVAHSESKTLAGALLEEPRPVPRVTVEAVEGLAVPLQCRHCEDAPCVAICPTRALSRVDENSPVVLDRERCIGCRWCVLVCPFGVIKMSRDGTAVIKCDLCVERLAQGDLPACVEACPVHALEYRELDEVTAEKRRTAARRLIAELRAESQQQSA